MHSYVHTYMYRFMGSNLFERCFLCKSLLEITCSRTWIYLLWFTVTLRLSVCIKSDATVELHYFLFSSQNGLSVVDNFWQT